MHRHCIPDPEASASRIQGGSAKTLAAAIHFGLVDQDALDRLEATPRARARKLLAAILAAVALVALGFVVACAAWGCAQVVFLNQPPGLGLLAAALAGGAVSVGCFLATMPGGPLDHYGHTAWKVRR